MTKQKVFTTTVEGKKITKKTIKAEEKPIEKLRPKPKDRLDLLLEEIQGVSKKIDKLKKKEGD